MKIIALMLIAIIITLTSFPSSSGKKRTSSGPPRGGLGSLEEVREREEKTANPSNPEEEMPKECKGEVGVCVLEHIIVDTGPPKYGGECCEKFRKAAPCVCTYLMSKDFKAKNAADGVLRGCRLSKPLCIKMPIPQTCRPEVINCVQVHLYGRAGQPQYGGACCKKFQNAISSLQPFLNSPDPRLRANINGVRRGCRFS